jgi:hypothetical protein
LERLGLFERKQRGTIIIIVFLFSGLLNVVFTPVLRPAALRSRISYGLEI